MPRVCSSLGTAAAVSGLTSAIATCVLSYARWSAAARPMLLPAPVTIEFFLPRRCFPGLRPNAQTVVLKGRRLGIEL